MLACTPISGVTQIWWQLSVLDAADSTLKIWELLCMSCR